MQCPGHLHEQGVLLCHVRGLEERARKHQLPVQGDALALEGGDVEWRRVIYQGKSALRRDEFHDVVVVGAGLAGLTTFPSSMIINYTGK